MSAGRIRVHFSPQIVERIGPDLLAWGDAMREWFHDGDPDRNFGRDMGNSQSGYDFTWARHLHMVPNDEVVDQATIEKWERTSEAFWRCSDRLIVYSLNKQDPLKYGMLMLALLGDPGGHDKLIKGAAAAQRRDDYERFAFTHQSTGELPPGSESA